ncbi:MAG: hypothetical protein AAF329_10430, partial [Cyanobacteria bacterium P01_A01_bin.17]
LSDPFWRVGFSPNSGGALALSAWNQELWQSTPVSKFVARDRRGPIRKTRNREQTQLNATELRLLQLLSQSIEGGEETTSSEAPLSPLSHQESIAVWMSLERALRHYVQYYFEQPIRSASLLETCFTPAVPRAVKS